MTHKRTMGNKLFNIFSSERSAITAVPCTQINRRILYARLPSGVVALMGLG